MPKRKIKRRYGKRKRRKRAKKRLKMAVKRAPLPRTYFCSLRYAECKTYSVGAGGVLTKQFYTANGMYDPDVTGLGHQPYGFNEMMALYRYYKVYASVITVTFVHSSTTSSVYPLNVGVAVEENGSYLPTAPDHAIEQGSSHRMMTVDPSAKAFIRKKWSLKKMGDKKTTNVVIGDASNNPGDQMYFCVWAANCSGNDPSSSVLAEVKITYFAKFFEKHELNQS